MKICFKNKKGFTLLEVMLAVAILIIATSMILSGFLATFSYSNNTTVFAKLGASNYSKSVQSLASMSSITDVNSRFHTPGTTSITVSCSYSGASNALSNFNVVLWKQTTASGGEGSLTYDATADASNVSTSRSSFTYSPSVCPGCNNGQGQLRKFKDTDGKIKWVCYNAASDTGKGCDYVEVVG